MEADMYFIGRHARKINRAAKISMIGEYRESFCAMLDAIPQEVLSALPAQQIAALIDANYKLSKISKRIAEDDAVANGFVWDHARGCARNLEPIALTSH